MLNQHLHRSIASAREGVAAFTLKIRPKEIQRGTLNQEQILLDITLYEQTTKDRTEWKRD